MYYLYYSNFGITAEWELYNIYRSKKLTNFDSKMLNHFGMITKIENF